MATTQTSIHVKVDPDIKSKSEIILNKIGISMSDLINMTLRRVIYERRIPFDTTVQDFTTPECLNVRTEEDLRSLITARLDSDENYLTLEEITKNLDLTI